MKNKLLFIPLLIILLALYLVELNDNKTLSSELKTNTLINNEMIKSCKDSLKNLEKKYDDEIYFSFSNNEEAKSYYDDYSITNVEERVIEQIYDLSAASDENPLIPYASMGDSKFAINKVRILNHKWALADFSDGKYWGELFIYYSISPDGTINLETRDHFLYPSP